jgi:hypothetical protein
MFQPGNRYRLPDPAGTVAVVEVHDAGLLHLPTGRLVACDPFWGSEVRRQVAPFRPTATRRSARKAGAWTPRIRAGT